MPRKQKSKSRLPPAEQGICRRLKFARETLGVSQAEVAKGVGVSRETVASYEVGRVAVPYDFALKVCWGLTVSEKWLAEGSIKSAEDFRFNCRRVQCLLMTPAFRQIAPRTLFSVAWANPLKRVYAALEKENGGKPRFAFARRDDVRVVTRYLEAYLEPIVHAVGEWDFNVPTEEYPPTMRFVTSLCAAADKIKAALKMDGVLTDVEIEELISRAIAAGAFPSEQRSDPSAVQQYVEKHWREYLKI